MPDMLFELGCEELPATFVEKSQAQLAGLIAKGLGEANLSHGPVQTYATPRRLIVSISDIPSKQLDQSKDIRGPGLKGAYGPDGAPTPALQGFCKSQGVDLADVRTEGDYVWVTKHVPGIDTDDVLAQILPAAVRAMTFDKTMRWGASRMRFVRPIRWIVALFDSKIIKFDIEGVPSGNVSRGHRFHPSGPFEVTNLDSLLSSLRERNVEPDAKVRRQSILSQIQEVTTGFPSVSEELLDENVYLTEWPTAHEAEFREEFLVLPDSVLITAMAKHERFFPVRSSDSTLTNRFISVRNGGQEATVRAGNEWVLNARFNDAKFFFDEDSRLSIDEFLQKTNNISFHEKLGTVLSRTKRLESLSREIAKSFDLSAEEIANCQKAGLYCKADLSTGLVSELASLQGVIGGEYAKKAGFADEICFAIAHQYNSDRVVSGDQPRDRAALIVQNADQLDKLAGYLGINLIPTGSSDPYGLRKAATILIENAWKWKGFLNGYQGAFDLAIKAYSDQGVLLDSKLAVQSLAEIFVGRYRALMHSTRYDILEAAILEGNLTAVFNPRQVQFRADALAEVASRTDWIQTAVRPINIVDAARKKGINFPEVDLAAITSADLDSESGASLAKVAATAKITAITAIKNEEPEQLLGALATLQTPINAFFDSTMVMIEDEKIRNARLGMLSGVAEVLLLAGDWSKLVIES